MNGSRTISRKESTDRSYPLRYAFLSKSKSVGYLVSWQSPKLQSAGLSWILGVGMAALFALPVLAEPKAAPESKPPKDPYATTAGPGRVIQSPSADPRQSAPKDPYQTQVLSPGNVLVLPDTSKAKDPFNTRVVAPGALYSLPTDDRPAANAVQDPYNTTVASPTATLKPEAALPQPAKTTTIRLYQPPAEEKK